MRETLDRLRQPLGERHPSPADPNESEVFSAAALFDDLVGDSLERPVDFLGGEKLSFFYDSHSGASS